MNNKDNAIVFDLLKHVEEIVISTGIIDRETILECASDFLTRNSISKETANELISKYEARIDNIIIKGIEKEIDHYIESSGCLERIIRVTESSFDEKAKTTNDVIDVIKKRIIQKKGKENSRLTEQENELIEDYVSNIIWIINEIKKNQTKEETIASYVAKKRDGIALSDEQKELINLLFWEVSIPIEKVVSRYKEDIERLSKQEQISDEDILRLIKLMIVSDKAIVSEFPENLREKRNNQIKIRVVELLLIMKVSEKIKKLISFGCEEEKIKELLDSKIKKYSGIIDEDAIFALKVLLERQMKLEIKLQMRDSLSGKTIPRQPGGFSL